MNNRNFAAMIYQGLSLRRGSYRKPQASFRSDSNKFKQLTDFLSPLKKWFRLYLSIFNITYDEYMNLVELVLAHTKGKANFIMNGYALSYQKSKVNYYSSLSLLALGGEAVGLILEAKVVVSGFFGSKTMGSHLAICEYFDVNLNSSLGGGEISTMMFLDSSILTVLRGFT